MSSLSERAPQGGLGRLVVATVAFAIVAPIGLAALPLAALLLLSHPRSHAELVTTGAAAGFGGWWLLMPGALPDQLVRAGAVIATTVFVTRTLRTRSPFTHRALLATGTATVTLALFVLALGSSWGELRWWVEHQSGLRARVLIAAMWARLTDPSLVSTGDQLEAWFRSVVQFIANFHPAIVALEVVTGLALATAIYHRVASEPSGAPLGRLRHFRFTEHLGWAAAIPLLVVLVPKLAAAKTAAGNLLLVTGALYATRGIAVAAFWLHLMGGSGFFLTVFMTVIFIVMLPAVVAGATVLGVLDAGLDFRKRWVTPQTSE